MTTTAAIPSADRKTASYRSEMAYRYGHGAKGSNSTSRNEARTTRWLKRAARRAERRNSRRDLANLV